ncbi:MAG: peptide deformylase [Candidatus Saccharimonadia bacterium]
MELEALSSNDHLLRHIAEPITRKELHTLEMQASIERLLSYVYGHNNKGDERSSTRPMTVGLSGPQVGFMRRLSVVDLAIGSKKFHDIHVLINPEIIKASKGLVTRREGCVNFAKIWGMVARHQTVTVRALDRSGNVITIEARGWASALLQHEIDHLNGILFIDHLSDPKKAHYVETKDIKEYNHKTAASWPHTIDVSELVKPI